MLDQRDIEKFKSLMRRKYSANYSDEEAREAIENLLNFFKIALEIHSKKEAKKTLTKP